MTEDGLVLKVEGMANAARRRKEALAAARQACIDAAMGRDDRTATADDAYEYVERTGIEPLGNAAGSLFVGKDWEFTGDWQASRIPSRHAHRNRVWVFVGDGTTSLTRQSEAKPLSPVQAQKELKALEGLYESTELSDAVYDKLRKSIFERLG